MLRIAVVIGCASSLGACVETSATAPPLAGPTRVALSSAVLPPSSEPGRLLKPNLGAGGSGVDPAAELAASARDRAAWAPLRREQPERPAFVASRQAGRGKSDDRTGMASTPPAAPRAGRGAAAPAEAARMDRLEREGQRTARPICGAC